MPKKQKVCVGEKFFVNSTIDDKLLKKAKDRKKLLSSGKPIRDKKGKIIRAAEFQNKSKSGEVSRVEPNRKWFGNTRVIAQSNLQKFIADATDAQRDPYKVILKPGKLPFSLLIEPKKKKSFDILKTETYEETFGSKSQRKKPKLSYHSLNDLVCDAESRIDSFKPEISEEDEKQLITDKCFKYGQSRRIWSELYKVVDSSDVLFQVLDARDPMGTRSFHIEKYLRDKKPHKNLILILNKCDLVPNQVIKNWLYILSREYPTVAFRASIKKSFGKSSVFQLLRQLSKLHIDKKTFSVGLFGYPNVGKSSIINSLVGRKVCNVAPIPGETKVWQYISLMKRVFLIDSPGVVYPSGDSESEIVLKGVVRVEYLQNPSEYINDLLDRVRPEYISRTYGVINWNDSEDLLTKIAHKSGRLNKGGNPDIETVAKMIISDFQRGKLPYFVKPPMEQFSTEPTLNELNESQNIDKIEKLSLFSDEHLKSINQGDQSIPI